MGLGLDWDWDCGPMKHTDNPDLEWLELIKEHEALLDALLIEAGILLLPTPPPITPSQPTQLEIFPKPWRG